EDKDSFLQFVDKIRQLGIEVDRLEKITSLIGTEKELTKTKDLLKEGRKNANLLIENIKNSEHEDKNKKSITEKKEYERKLKIKKKKKKKTKKIKLRNYNEAILNTEFEIAKETNERVTEMKKDFEELQSMFIDFKELVDKQDAPLENIEKNVVDSVNAVDTA